MHMCIASYTCLWYETQVGKQHDLHEEAELGKPLLWYKAWQWYEDTKEKEVDLREKIDSGIGKIVNSSLN